MRVCGGLGREKGWKVTKMGWGYQVTVTELVGWEHSMKNELIIAKYTGQKKRAASDRLRALLAELGLNDLLNSRFALPVDPAAVAAQQV